jgi:hypothetical protein
MITPNLQAVQAVTLPVSMHGNETFVVYALPNGLLPDLWKVMTSTCSRLLAAVS